MDLLEGQPRCVRKAYAGTVLGVVMGGFASVANAVQSHGSSLVTIVARDALVRQAVTQRTIKTMGTLGMWSGLYHTTRCILDDRGVSEPENSLTALTASAVPFLAIKAFRSEMAWIGILFALDLYHRPSSSTARQK